MPFVSTRPLRAGSDREMKLRYRSLARRAPGGIIECFEIFSDGPRVGPSPPSQVAGPEAERCLLASAAMRLASAAKAAPSTSPSDTQRRTTVSDSLRNRSQSRKRPCLFLRTSNDPALRRRVRVGKTSV